MQFFSQYRAVTAALGATFCGLLAYALVFATPASAHIALIAPPARDGHDFPKPAPCGKAGSERSATPITPRSGAMLTHHAHEATDRSEHDRTSIYPRGTDVFENPRGDKLSQEGAVGGLEGVPWAALAGLIGLIALGRRNRSRKPIRVKASKNIAKPRQSS